MSKTLEMVFAAFMEHCIQSPVILLLMLKVSKVSNTMYCTLYTGPLAPPRMMAIGYTVFEKASILWV